MRHAFQLSTAGWLFVALVGPGTAAAQIGMQSDTRGGATNSSRGRALNWVLRATEGITPRNGHAMAYDSRPSSRQTVLFGGGDYGELDATMGWSGCGWSILHPGVSDWPTSSSPGQRGGHAMAYDWIRQRIVLFGGRYFEPWNVYGETWEWNGAAWTKVHPGGAGAPPARAETAMAYDGGLGVAVLFGGTNWYSTFGDTWEWNGNSWISRPGTGPSPRSEHALAYDGARGVVVLFGGRDASGIALGDTWERNGTGWVRVHAGGAGAPPPRGGHGLAYDSNRHVVVLFGGTDANWTALGDTWEWNGVVWTPVQTDVSPSPRYGHAMSFDSARGRVVVVGGGYGNARTETWEYGLLPDPSSTDCNQNGIPDECEASVGPLVQVEPGTQSHPVAGTATFAATATGHGELAYHWRHAGQPLADGGRISGATTPTLTITSLMPADAGTYDVLVTDTCATATSSPVTLAVTGRRGDLNCDGAVNFDDIDPFVLALQGAAQYAAAYPDCERMLADCNTDGVVDFDDIDPFVARIGG